jgi:hypothetical protein
MAMTWHFEDRVKLPVVLDVNDAGLRTQARPWVVPPAPGWALPRSAQRPEGKDTPAT